MVVGWGLAGVFGGGGSLLWNVGRGRQGGCGRERESGEFLYSVFGQLAPHVVRMVPLFRNVGVMGVAVGRRKVRCGRWKFFYFFLDI